jgi:hypothetical protein
VQVRGGADLAQPGLRHHVPEAGNGGEQAGLALPAGRLARDPLIQPGDRGVKAGDAVLVQAAQQRVMLAIWSIWASFWAAAARLTCRPSVSPVQRSRWASPMRAIRLSRILASRGRWAGSGRSSGQRMQASLN